LTYAHVSVFTGCALCSVAGSSTSSVSSIWLTLFDVYVVSSIFIASWMSSTVIAKSISGLNAFDNLLNFYNVDFSSDWLYCTYCFNALNFLRKVAKSCFLVASLTFLASILSTQYFSNCSHYFV
jgi:hypothetical protein